MNEKDIRLDKLFNKVIDDVYAWDKIEVKMLREDWVNEIKPEFYLALDIVYGGIHNNILPYIEYQKMFEEYEQSEFIL